jgi:hypothetical protein
MERKATCSSAINRLVNKYEMTQTIVDNKKSVVGKMKAGLQRTLYVFHEH